MTKNVNMGVYIQQTVDGSIEVPFNYHTNLTAVEKMNFVNNVTNLVVTDNYYTVIKDMFFDFVIVNLFTDVDTTEISEAPDSINRIEEFLESTNVAEIVKSNMEVGLLDSLVDAVNKNIEYRTGIHTNSLSDVLVQLVKTVERKVSDIDLDGMIDFANKINGITDNLTADNLVSAYLDTKVAKQNIDELKKHREERAKKLDSMKFDKTTVTNISQAIKDKEKNKDGK